MYFKKTPHLQKSQVCDIISYDMVKHLFNKIIIFLSHIYKVLFILSYISSTWKHSVFILIFKPNKQPQDPTSYRSISLLSTFYKIFEKILLKRLFPLASANSIIPHIQFGFRSKHSTVHQLHRTVNTYYILLFGKNNSVQ